LFLKIGENKMRKIFLLSLIMIVSISCSSLNKSVNKANFSASASTSLEADVEVGGKIKGTSKATLLFGFLQMPGGPNKFADGVFGQTFTNPFDPTGALKSAAAYDAMTKSGADLIVNPQYVITVDNMLLFRSYKVDVTGYKGTIKGFK